MPAPPLRLTLDGYVVEIERRPDGGAVITAYMMGAPVRVGVPVADWRRVVDYVDGKDPVMSDPRQLDLDFVSPGTRQAGPQQQEYDLAVKIARDALSSGNYNEGVRALARQFLRAVGLK